MDAKYGATFCTVIIELMHEIRHGCLRLGANLPPVKRATPPTAALSSWECQTPAQGG
jgi:hypothetical protein